VPGPVTVGRADDNDVVFPDYSVSQQHCQIAVVEQEIQLMDRGSTNGTFLNGVRLVPRKPVVLVGGDTVTLGRFNCLFHLPHGFAGHVGADAA
jgi:pSer/pThr/pTyr-binding forkhead associated (FHA) protein